MADQATGFGVADALKWLGGALGSGFGLRFYCKARNAGYLDRIVKLERRERDTARVIQEAVEQLQELASTVDIESANTHRRFQRVESDAREMRREVSQDLRRIADRLDEQLHRSAPPPEQPHPPAQR